jgi:hypothetical protein
VDDFMDLRIRILDAVARRDASARLSPGWRAAEAEVQSLSQRVWLIHRPLDDGSPQARTDEQAVSGPG